MNIQLLILREKIKIIKRIAEIDRQLKEIKAF